MKNVMIAALIIAFIPAAIAQRSLNNTIWLAHTNIPISADIQLVFKNDSLFILDDKGKAIGESMVYSLRNDSLFIQKVSGATPCAKGTSGWYKVEWPENTEGFLLQNLNDPCIARVNFFTRIQLKGKSNDGDKLASVTHVAPERQFYLGAKDSSGGINLYRAYELLKGRKSQTVTVGLIGHYDITHEDLKGIAWLNQREIPSNGIDDDKNGYADDLHGWN